MIQYHNKFDALTEEETQRFFELYVNYCTQHGQSTSMKDFILWFEEEYGE